MEAWRSAYVGFLALGTMAHWETSTLAPTLITVRRLTIEVLGPPTIVMALVAMAALGAGIAQTGGVSVHMTAIAWKPDRINPITNVKNLFSLRAAARLAKSLIPAGILAVFAVQRIARQLDIPPFSMERLEILAQDIYGLLLAAAWLLFAWSAIDYPRARVVVNERTGTVVIGGTVRLQPVSILHGGLSVNVISQVEVSQPGALSSGTTQVVQQTTVDAQDKPVNEIYLKEGATVEDLVQQLQRTGAGARDVISILQAMKEAGALEADLEVL